jgi:poly(A) polymerase
VKFFPLPRSPQEKRDFFTGILTSPGADLCFRELASRGALQTLFPEIHAMIGVTQPPEFHPEGDVFEHTMLMLHHMAYPDPLLGWSVLLHDVGKPLTRSVELSGRIRFFNHEVKGAEMAREILGKMAFPEEEINAVVSTGDVINLCLIDMNGSSPSQFGSGFTVSWTIYHIPTNSVLADGELVVGQP